MKKYYVYKACEVGIVTDETEYTAIAGGSTLERAKEIRDQLQDENLFEVYEVGYAEKDGLVFIND